MCKKEIKLAIKDLVEDYKDGYYHIYGQLDEEIEKIINLIEE